MLVAARGCLLGLELAEVGTNSVVRRKTLFESAERADWLRNFFSSEWSGAAGRKSCGADILCTVFGRCYLNTRGGGWKPPFHGLRATNY